MGGRGAGRSGGKVGCPGGAAGVQGVVGGEFARGLGVGLGVVVSGQLVTASAEPVVDAAERSAWGEVAKLAADPTSTAARAR